MSDTSSGARFLRGAAVFFGLLGLGIAVWLIDKAVRYPGIRAEQAGHVAPLWWPFIGFVLLCSAGMAYLFWRAGRRAETGEDLFAQRHRRRPGEDRDVLQDDATDETSPGMRTKGEGTS